MNVMEIKVIQSSPLYIADEVNNEMKHHGWQLHGEPHIMEMVYYPHEKDGVLKAPEKTLIITQVLKKG